MVMVKRNVQIKTFFYHDENKLQTLYWWTQMCLANINTLMIEYKSSNGVIIDHVDVFSIDKFISKFLSTYDLRLKYCISYLYSFLQLIQKTVHIDDSYTIHAFAYIPQPLDIDPITGKILQYDFTKLCSILIYTNKTIKSKTFKFYASMVFTTYSTKYSYWRYSTR